MEKAFLQDRLTKNPFQDPCGGDAHQGLEHWLDKFHQPTVPNFTIITDPEYYVFLWFHDAIGNLIECPYLSSDWKPQLEKTAIDFGKMNSPFKNPYGIQSGTDDLQLPKFCVDLTPFVRQATLPEIKPAGGDQIETLFGKTTGGAFSPYASDGQSSITLSMVDTEFSILDSLFYPWMKDINSPWWYRPDKAFTEWATPYPMATLEVQRPRMRYRPEPSPMNSRKDAQYVYYSYKYIGIKPTNYAPFEVNGGGVSNLLRSLTLSCDMCLVDLTGDVAGTGKGSVNLGNRQSFIFQQAPGSGSGNQPDQEEQDPAQQEPDLQQQKEDAQKELDDAKQQADDVQDQIDQQRKGDMPGEDEPEWRGEDPLPFDTAEKEFQDMFDTDDSQEVQVDTEDDENPNAEKLEKLKELADKVKDKWNDIKESWQQNHNWFGRSGKKEIQQELPVQRGLRVLKSTVRETDVANPVDSLEFGDSNGDMSNLIMEDESKYASRFGDFDFVGQIQQTLMDVGVEASIATSTEQGWLIDTQDEIGSKPSSLDSSVGVAVDVVQSVVDLVVDSSGNVSPAQMLVVEAIGHAGSLALSTQFSNGFSTSFDHQENNALFNKEFGGPIADLGEKLNDVIGKSCVAFGVVSDAPSAQGGNLTTVGGMFDKVLSTVFPFGGDRVGNAANVIGGVSANLVGVGGVDESEKDDALEQLMNAKLQVGATENMATTINAAVGNLSNNAVILGNIAESIKKASTINQSSSFVADESNNDPQFGQLVQRMVKFNGAKPTPFECLVGIITKQDLRLAGNEQEDL